MGAPVGATEGLAWVGSPGIAASDGTVVVIGGTRCSAPAFKMLFIETLSCLGELELLEDFDMP